MAARGRGRGRGRAVSYELAGDDESTIIVKPIELSTRRSSPTSYIGRDYEDDLDHIRNEPSNNEGDAVCAQLNLLSLACGDSDRFESVCEMIKNDANLSKDRLKKIANRIHTKFIEDKEFAVYGSKLCGKLAFVEVEGVQFRAEIIKLLQKDYEEREELRCASVVKFMNTVTCLCWIFLKMTARDGSHYEVLSRAIVAYLKMLTNVNSTAEEFNLFDTLLQMCGKHIQDASPEKFEEILNDIRTKILVEAYTSSQKAVLLHVFEMAVSSWQPMSLDVSAFYKNCFP